MKLINSNALNLASLVLVPAALQTFTACSSPSKPPPPVTSSSVSYKEGVPGGTVVNTIVVSARVTAIDQATRQATLMDSDGKKFTVTAPPEAVNFDQIHTGDQVKATLTEELVVYLGDENSPSDDAAAAVVAVSPKGGKPGGFAAGTILVTGTITALDAKNHTATLRFADGSSRTFPVRSDVDLGHGKVGDRVKFRVTKMLAIDLEKEKK
jgi:hypothetical protein